MKQFHTYQWSILQPYFNNVRTVLDFGCGDMGLDYMIAGIHPDIHITGVDVFNSKPSLRKNMTFFQYDGHVLPFANTSFDLVYAYHVFHHCSDPLRAMKECVRVMKKRMIMIEPVLRSVWELPGFVLMDTITNSNNFGKVPLPFHIHTASWYKEVFKDLHLTLVEERVVGVLPHWLPLGETKLYVLEK